VNAALLASSLSLGFLFLRDKSAVLKHAATATLQQSVAILFERAERLLAGGDGAAVDAAVKADAAEGDSDAGGPSALLQACRFLLQDLVLVLGGLPTTWMRRGTAVPRVLAGDLVEYALREHAPLFRALPSFHAIAGNLLVPLLLRQLPVQLSFPLLLRLFRIARAFLFGLHTTLTAPTRALLSLLIRMVHGAANGEVRGRCATLSLCRAKCLPPPTPPFPTSAGLGCALCTDARSFRGSGCAHSPWRTPRAGLCGVGQRTGCCCL
jgi:hypothetical protein